MNTERPPEGARWKLPDWEVPEKEETADPAIDPSPSEPPSEAIPIPEPDTALTVPLKLNDFKRHWPELAKYAVLTKDDTNLFELLESDSLHKEITDEEKEKLDASRLAIKVILTESKLKQLVAHGKAYLNLKQVEYAINDDLIYFSVPADEWVRLNEQGIVDSDDLTEDEIENLQSIKLFRDIYDAKFNKQLIAQREKERLLKTAENEVLFKFGCIAVILIFGIVGYGIYHFFF